MIITQKIENIDCVVTDEIVYLIKSECSELAQKKCLA